jgi:hypothetical protein
MNIGYVPSPREWSRWPEALALLEPAAALADEKMEILPPGHLLWAVMDGDELMAVATARLTADKRCEVPLIGGRDHKRWLSELDRRIGAAAAEAGATHMTAFGRSGWRRALRLLGWAVCSEEAGFCTYAREL